MSKASKIVVTLLDVGQGSGTFVEIYTGSKITATALLDLGSERAKTEAGQPAVKLIEKSLNSMTTPRIDFCSLSHSDSDHINLVQDLLSKFDKPGTKKATKPILEVGKVIYGGHRVRFAKHGGTNVINDLEAYQPTGTVKPEPLPANNCSYSQPTPMFEIQDVSFNLLVGNHIAGEHTIRTIIGDKKWRVDSFSLNTYSLIFVVVFDDWKYVITGDATGATIDQANFYIDKFKVKFGNVAVLTMPHHSSETTTFALTSGKRPHKNERVPDAAKKVIESFANSVKAMSIHASAEDVGSFRHPSAYTMSYFWELVEKTAWYVDPVLSKKQHLYNAYFKKDDDYSINVDVVDPQTKKTFTRQLELLPFDDWWTFATNYAVFTNRYYVREAAYEPDKNETATFPPNPGRVTDIPKSGALNSPPFAVAWQYTSDAATQKTTLHRVENRKDGLGFVSVAVMQMSKDTPTPTPACSTPEVEEHTRPPSRTMAPRPPAHHTGPNSGNGSALTPRQPRRVRPLDV